MVGGRSLVRGDGTTWQVTNLSEEEQGIEGVNAIWGSAPDDVWVVGPQSTAAHFDGSAWRRYIVAGTENTAVWGSGPDDVYVAGLFESEHWDGSGWQPIEMDAFRGAEGIWGFAADDVWMADGSGEMAHFDGTTWQVTELEFTAEASALWGAAPDDVWGVGTPGGILHFDGSAWREVTHQTIGSPYLRVFHGVHGSAAGDVWVIGSQLGEGGAEPQLYRGGAG
jgi:hypothetical protein